ncbi:ribonuclease H-like domain-containing protein [Tanacetum coccineum]
MRRIRLQRESQSGTLVRQGSVYNRDLRMWASLAGLRCPAEVPSGSLSSVLPLPDNCCDSLGDLYPITQPSLTPHALLSVSPTTHQRLRESRREESGCQATIRTVLSLALAWNCLVHQLDVKNAFLNGTLVDRESKHGFDGDMVSDSTLYCSLEGGLRYLTFTRPDISYAVQQICLHMHDPREPHFGALKGLFVCSCLLLDHGLQLHVSYLLSWSPKRQVTLSRSSAEAEYRGVANVVAEKA